MMRWIGLAAGAVVASVSVGVVWAAAPDPVGVVPGSWTMVVVPDTQNYVSSAANAPIFTQMMNWVVGQQAARDIRMVTTVGDLTNNNNATQWGRVQQSLDVLNGTVPYVIATGNHDYGSNGSANVRTTLVNDYFTYSRNPSNNFLMGGALRGFYEFGRMENAYYTMEANGQKYMVLSLEWSPRDGVVAWADQVVGNHPDHRVLLTTHAYLYYDNTRYDWAAKGGTQSWSPYAYGTANDPGGVNDGEELWQKLVKKHPNFWGVVNGHVLNDQVGYLMSTGEGGNNVHQMLFNAQNDPLGGNGWLRLLEFRPDDRTVQVKTYSPYLDQWRTGVDYQFTLQLTPIPEPGGVLVACGVWVVGVGRRRGGRR